LILLAVGAAPGALAMPEVARELAYAGYHVEVILDMETRHFVGSASFAGNAEVVDKPSEAPEALVFAPATTGTLARLAHNLVERSVAEVYSVHDRTVFIVPDLDAATAGHPAVEENLRLLGEDGHRILAGSDRGMAAADEVVAGVLGGLGGPLSGLRIVVTAGGTREPMDSVRFVGNRSSGKMGVAIAREALRFGAEVSLVAANIAMAEPGINWFAVETVDEMRERVMSLVEDADVLVMAAAVSDFKPASVVENKIRRGEGLTVELVATDDILKAVRERNPGLFMVGFAATHGDPVPDAREKLATKGVNLVVGNDISRKVIGFGAEENEVYIVSESGERFVPQTSKREIARTILYALATEMN
jgi:phosphopantothenoylcysteine decarboxylase/phosphopantothenate--cysteine ligase